MSASQPTKLTQSPSISAGKVFMDRAEELGVRSLLESFASHYAGRDREGVVTKRMCSCDASEMQYMMRHDGLDFKSTHDMTCACHRFVVFCGTEEDKESMRWHSYLFATLCMMVDENPGGYLYADVVFARGIIGTKWIRGEGL